MIDGTHRLIGGFKPHLLLHFSELPEGSIFPAEKMTNWSLFPAEKMTKWSIFPAEKMTNWSLFPAEKMTKWSIFLRLGSWLGSWILKYGRCIAWDANRSSRASSSRLGNIIS